ncbi:glycosyltransferase family 9 protein [Phenylobacterium sp. VNQ135]|uniref:glycosyltransferase family 9 protein n=1 Tax=Phenylobacterium sp. VNQ135 TaxID=3400922 RepID=UPI003BFEFC00
MDDAARFAEAVALQQAGRLAEAAALYEDIAARVATLNLARNLGACLLELGRFDAAAHWLGLAHQRLPDDAGIELSLAEALLGAGRYAEGWPHFEARVRAHPSETSRFSGSAPEWRGEPLAGRDVVVVHEQGLGDQIMFARFAPLLKARGAGRVTLSCHAALAPVFAGLAGVDEVIGLAPGDQARLPDDVAWVRCMSLAGRLGMTPDTLPGEPYLHAAPRPVDARIGVAVAGNPKNARDAHRSMRGAAAEALLALPDAISLEPADAGPLPQTAEIIAGLDLVVSVDTALAHLAGALGKPVWVLLSDVGQDWRWMRGRDDSPWYPSARLFRQPRGGDWDAVVADVRRALS